MFTITTTPELPPFLSVTPDAASESVTVSGSATDPSDRAYAVSHEHTTIFVTLTPEESPEQAHAQQYLLELIDPCEHTIPDQNAILNDMIITALKVDPEIQ